MWTFPLGMCPGVELLDHRECMCSDLVNAAQSFSKWFHQLTIPHQFTFTVDAIHGRKLQEMF